MKNPKKIVEHIIEFALTKKAEHIVLMDLRGISPATDYFVICNGRSESQIKAIADAVVEGLSQEGVKVWRVEGYESARWILLDLIDVVVHVFLPDVRDYYSLERLWGDAPSEKFSGEDGEPIKKAV